MEVSGAREQFIQGRDRLIWEGTEKKRTVGRVENISNARKEARMVQAARRNDDEHVARDEFREAIDRFDAKITYTNKLSEMSWIKYPRTGAMKWDERGVSC